MRILMVSMSSLHFFRWTEQLKDAGHEVFWFDIRDSKKEISRLDWVRQINRWRIKYNYPRRYYIKKKIPRLYRFIQKFNDNDVAKVFEQKLLEIRPDVVHSFAMQIACIPILEVMEKHSGIKWMYSSWGSDVYFSKWLNLDQNAVRRCFSRVDYLITDCERDYRIALDKGFHNTFLGVFPGNGGIDFDKAVMESETSGRKVILVKGYNSGVGRGLNIVKALSGDALPQLRDFRIVIYGADQLIEEFVEGNEALRGMDIKIYPMKSIIPNEALMELMGKSYIHIGNGVSDGIPNSLLEAMGMGAFPIQSNPGNATAEVITDNQNGLLIHDPENVGEIRSLLLKALSDPGMVEKAFRYNIGLIRQKYGRDILKPKVMALYESIY